MADVAAIETGRHERRRTPQERERTCPPLLFFSLPPREIGKKQPYRTDPRPSPPPAWPMSPLSCKLALAHVGHRPFLVASTRPSCVVATRVTSRSAAIALASLTRTTDDIGQSTPCARTSHAHDETPPKPPPHFGSSRRRAHVPRVTHTR